MSVTPWALPVIPKLKRYTMETVLAKKVRLDGRKFEQYRAIEVIPNYVERAEGSALVKIGNTMVLAGVKMDIVAPFPDTPNEGVLMVHAEFVPLASPTFEPGPPDENAIELARLVDRSLREIRAVDLEALVLEPGKHVWRVYVDLYVLDHDGNLYDASMLAAMAALLVTKIPAAVKTPEGGYTVDRTRFTSLLPVKHKVVSVTVAKVSNKLIVDPTFEEEQVADAKLFIAVSDDGRIAGTQKSGMGDFTEQEVETAIRLALTKAPELIRILDEKVIPVRAEIEKLLSQQPEEAAQPQPRVPEHEEPIEAAAEEPGESGEEQT